MQEYVAYKGRVFQIEWYFAENGKSQPLEYAEGLSQKDRVKLATLLRLMGDIGKIRGQDKFRNEGDQIYAFKPQPHRFLCFFMKGKKIIITNAFHKKQQKIPKSEKERAIRARNDYLKRVDEHTYYE
ncbi:MAG: type II toxin-antitoxin system RelE/ParE family toxin [Bacteroidetes bacterium]|nr:MAG: type II toxin-antitoxin system RelE/ParE family toxin [Bacteroidota bacterium]